MALDIQGLLAEISPEDPCGPDLSYDPEYSQFMRDAQGTPAQVMGDSVIEAQEPDWRGIKSQAIDLFARTKDLDLAMVMLLALIVNDGPTGLADGLDLLQQLLDRYWDAMHPRLDPDDDNDPLQRMNLISALNAAPGALGDTRRYQTRVREMPLCRSRQLGAFSYRQVLIARGEIDRPEGDAAPDMMLIDGAFTEADVEELKRDAEASVRAHATIKAIDAWILDKVGSQHAPDISGFIRLLGGVQKVYEEQLARRGLGPAPAEDGAAGVPAGESGGGTGDPISGSIRSDADVVMMLGKICDYYERKEPSSPIPMLLRRVERLVGKSFVDLVRDLSPDALSQLKVVAGVDTFEP